MLKDDFYTIATAVPKDVNSFRVTIHLDVTHDIFKGHFPELPITPGVCMLGIIKELLQENIGKKLMLHDASNIKFLSLIDPNQFPEVDVEIKQTKNEDGTYTVDGTIFTGENACFKISKAHYR
jgi:3-hydroxyacyl-[acyl-carrier-protein] dehydratase